MRRESAFSFACVLQAVLKQHACAGLENHGRASEQALFSAHAEPVATLGRVLGAGPPA
jgi:hypothetical protein